MEVDILIDKITDCLIDTRTGQEVETEYRLRETQKRPLNHEFLITTFSNEEIKERIKKVYLWKIWKWLKNVIIKLWLSNGTVKMMVVVTNLGSISYLVKKDRFNRKKAIEIYNYAVSLHNEGSDIHDYQKAVSYFLSNCRDANIVYEDY